MEREAAEAAQERAVLAELRSQRMGEQESLIAALAGSLEGLGWICIYNFLVEALRCILTKHYAIVNR